MSSVPQAFVNKLITENEWELLFNKCIVSIVGVSFSPSGDTSGSYGGTTFPLNFRYLSYTTQNLGPNGGIGPNELRHDGCVWSNVLNDNTKWVIEHDGTTMTITPNNRNGTFVGWNTGYAEGSQMAEVANSTISSSKWEPFSHPDAISWNGTQYQQMWLGGVSGQAKKGISNPWNTPAQGSNLGLILTGIENSSQLIQIIEPSDALKTAYCTGTSLSSQICVDFCSTGGCTIALSSYCVGPNLSNEACLSYCRRSNINCDTLLTERCAAMIGPSLNYNAFLSNPANADMCGCFLAENVYTNFSAAMQKSVGHILSGNIINCYFPQCNTSTIHPFAWKNSNQVCPPANACIESVSIVNGGQMGPISINQNGAGCEKLTPNKGDVPSGSGGTTPNVPISQKVNNKVSQVVNSSTALVDKIDKHVTQTQVKVGLVVVIALIAIGIGWTVSEIKRHNKKK